MSTEQEMEAVFEAVLFVTPEPVPRLKLLSLFAERDKEAAEEALDRVLDRYRPAEGEDESENGRGVMVDEVAGGIRLVTRPELHEFLRRFFEISGNTKLTMAGLETLAIIAYRQPMTGPEIQELRGKNSSGVLKTLLERRMIRISGRKEVVGKPFLYSTTRDFLLHFGLKNLKDLPPLEEFEETFLSEGGSLEPDEEELAMQQLALVEDADAEADDSEAGDAEDSPGDSDSASSDPLEADSEAGATLSDGASADREAGGQNGDIAGGDPSSEAVRDDAVSDEAAGDDMAGDDMARGDMDRDDEDRDEEASDEAELEAPEPSGDAETDAPDEGGASPTDASEQDVEDEVSVGRVLEMPGNPPPDASADEEE